MQPAAADDHEVRALGGGNEGVDGPPFVELHVSETPELVGVNPLSARRGEEANARAEAFLECARYSERVERAVRPVDADRQGTRNPRAAPCRWAGDEDRARSLADHLGDEAPDDQPSAPAAAVASDREQVCATVLGHGAKCGGRASGDDLDLG